MKSTIGILLSLILSLGIIKSLWGSSYFPMHDDTQIARVVVMGQALRQGQFPVRWVSDLGYGYGYPIFNFYGPLPYYFGGSLYAIGLDGVIATKIMFGMGALLGSIFCFFLLRSMYGQLAALVGSVLFAYAPYHAVQIYIRGSVGEYWAISFVPLVLWGMFLIGKQRERTGVVIGSMGLASVIVSHTILGFLTVVLSVVGISIFWLAQRSKKALQKIHIVYLIALIVSGLGLSAFFWLPALVEMSSTGVSQMIRQASTGFFDHFVCLRQLWDSPWGYAGSAAGCTADGMSFKLGKFHIGMLLVSFVIWLVSLKKKTNKDASMIFFLGISLFCISILGLLDSSKPIWQWIPYVSFIQYPWRLLSFSTLAISICGAYVVSRISEKNVRIGISILIVVICIGVNAKLFTPQYLYERPSASFETVQEIRFRASKVSDEYLPPGIVKPKTKDEVVQALFKSSHDVGVKILNDSDVYVRAELNSPVDQSITIQKAPFPGWQYRVNGEKVIPTIVLGLPTVILSEGKSTVELVLTNTPVRIWGNVISLLFLILVGGIYFYGKKTKA